MSKHETAEIQARSHGGKRPGAGRKAGGHNKTPTRVAFMIRLSPEILETLRSHVPRGKRSQFITRAIALLLDTQQRPKQSDQDQHEDQNNDKADKLIERCR